MSSYGLGLALHNLNRWAVLALGVAVVARAFTGWRARREWRPTDSHLHRAFVGAVDLQLTIGIALLVLSPLPEAFLADWRAGMKVSTLRFFVMDHAVTMLIAVWTVHAGATRLKKIAEARTRHRVVYLSTLAALVLILGAIPWPGLHYGRPFVRLPWSEVP